MGRTEYNKKYYEKNKWIDHSHNNNKVRGLLCPYCNTSLGLLKENVQTIKNMILYLEK